MVYSILSQGADLQDEVRLGTRPPPPPPRTELWLFYFYELDILLSAHPRIGNEIGFLRPRTCRDLPLNGM